ncbi:hypothetical protein BCD67_10505 [Oscillatoriales cyanobacterium USR001]|nr:hypothetical protein BCD67_10505 [Oscillatoriales cyanobacterium USR001]
MQNLRGRALEYAIVAEIIQRLPQNQINLTQRTLQNQQRDLPKYLHLSVNMQQNYQQCSARIFQWLDSNFAISTQPLSIDRLPDKNSQQGDVTDIRIVMGSQEINLSVKHNHSALKHQRPASTAQHCGYTKGSPEDIQFRTDYNNITTAFTTTVQGDTYFRDLDNGVVLTLLYIPICTLVTEFINSFCSSPISASHLFSFLVGRIDFYKIIFYESQNLLLVQDFRKPPFVNSVTAQSDQSYAHLQFSNAWKISMRLHTASSRITSNPSLKFDTNLDSSIVVPQQQFTL